MYTIQASHQNQRLTEWDICAAQGGSGCQVRLVYNGQTIDQWTRGPYRAAMGVKSSIHIGNDRP